MKRAAGVVAAVLAGVAVTNIVTSDAAPGDQLTISGDIETITLNGELVWPDTVPLPPVTTEAATTTEPSTTQQPATTTTQPPATTTTAATTTTTLQPATTTTAPTAGVLWVEDFATETDLGNLSAQGHDGLGIVNQPEASSNGHQALTFHADHDTACGSPSTTRDLTGNNTAQRHLYWCPNAGGHFMSAMNTTSYVQVAFAPLGDNGQARIFPPTANRVCWDQNLTNLGSRKWIEVLVLSRATYESNIFPTVTSAGTVSRATLIYFNPDHIVPGVTAGINADFQFVNIQGSRQVASRGQWVYRNFTSTDRAITDKATRYRNCLTDNGNGTVTFDQDRPEGHARTVMTAAFPAGERVFVFIDATYNADKAENPPSVPDPYTWHWDTITIGEG